MADGLNETEGLNHSSDRVVPEEVEENTTLAAPDAASGAPGEQLFEEDYEDEDLSDVIHIEDLSADENSVDYTGGTPWSDLLPLEVAEEEEELLDGSLSEPTRESQADLCRDTDLFTNDINETYEFFNPTIDMLKKGKTEIGLTRRFSLKAIDEIWVKAVEDSLTALEYVVRHPSAYIEELEEIKPIEQSRHITQRSTRHLAQHTNFISKIEGDEITPSKILNITREETMMTYENRFINTLLNRLFIFIDRRYRQAKQSGDDEMRTVLTMSNTFKNTEVHGKYTLNFEVVRKVEKSDVDENADAKFNFSGDLWHRVEKLEDAVNGYAHSSFTKAMGNNYVRPPILHTNAINKNKYLRQCLALWEFVESYEGIGYEMLVRETAEKPTDAFVEELYRNIGIQYFQFRNQILKLDDPGAEDPLAEEETTEPLKPKFIDTLKPYTSDDFNIRQSFYRKRVDLEANGKRRRRKLSDDELAMERAINIALHAEAVYEQRRLEAIKAAEEEARRLAEEEEARKRAEEEAEKRAEEEEAARLVAEAEARKAAEAAAIEEAARKALEDAENARRQVLLDNLAADKRKTEMEEAARRKRRNKVGNLGRKRKKKYQKIWAIEAVKNPQQEAEELDQLAVASQEPIAPETPVIPVETPTVEPIEEKPKLTAEPEINPNRYVPASEMYAINEDKETAKQLAPVEEELDPDSDAYFEQFENREVYQLDYDSYKTEESGEENNKDKKDDE